MTLPKMHQMDAPVGRWREGGVGVLIERRHKVNADGKVTGVRRATVRSSPERRRICECLRFTTLSEGCGYGPPGSFIKRSSATVGRVGL